MLDSQSQWEIDGLIYVLNAYNVETMLEIGSKNAETPLYLANKCALKKVVMVDNNPGPNFKHNLGLLRQRGIEAKHIKGDSTEQRTVSSVVQHAPFDFVFIDGDHRYKACRSDWEHYGPMGRIVAFHDIAGDGKAKDPEKFKVGKVWNELNDGRRPVFEIVEYGRKMGIGVIWNGDG